MPEKNKLPKAAALKYDPASDQAPIISALGQGKVAERIIETAQQNDVPVVQNTDLTEVLSSLSVGDAIPRELYEAVAQVLVFVSQQDANYLKKFPF